MQTELVDCSSGHRALDGRRAVAGFGVRRCLDSGRNNFILVASQPLAGRSADQWAAEISLTPDWGDTCAPNPEPVTIEGTAGLLVLHCPNADARSAVAWIEDRGYLIVGYDLPSLDYFKAILASVKLRPGEAIDPTPSQSP